ncbi:MAG TPA: AzlC family ABC transporter permease [Egibacteraceae bacterium]
MDPRQAVAVGHLAYEVAALRHHDLLAEAARRRAIHRATTRRGPRGTGAAGDAWAIVASVAPFGLVVGVTIALVAGRGVPAAAGLVATPLLYGGSAQVAALNLLASGAGALAVLATVAIVNARLIVYGAALAPHFSDQPHWFRWLAPAVLVDQTYAAATARQHVDGRAFRRYWLTVGGILGAGWTAAVAIGAALGPALAQLGPLRLAAPACFVALLVPRLRERRALLPALVAAVVAAAAASAPSGLGLLAGAASGFVVAAVMERRRP